MEETITIERMGYGSEAVGRLESGKAVFVEGGAPGDVAALEIVEDKPTFARARIARLVQALRAARPPALRGGRGLRRMPLAAPVPMTRSWRPSAPTWRRRSSARRSSAASAPRSWCAPVCRASASGATATSWSWARPWTSAARSNWGSTARARTTSPRRAPAPSLTTPSPRRPRRCAARCASRKGRPTSASSAWACATACTRAIWK